MLKETVGELGIIFMCAWSFKITRIFEVTMITVGMNMQITVSTRLNACKSPFTTLKFIKFHFSNVFWTSGRRFESLILHLETNDVNLLVWTEHRQNDSQLGVGLEWSNTGAAGSSVFESTHSTPCRLHTQNPNSYSTPTNRCTPRLHSPYSTSHFNPLPTPHPAGDNFVVSRFAHVNLIL